MGEKESILKFSGVIVELKKNALFTVKLDQNGHLVNAHASGKLRKNRIRCLLNDKVEEYLNN